MAKKNDACKITRRVVATKVAEDRLPELAKWCRAMADEFEKSQRDIQNWKVPIEKCVLPFSENPELIASLNAVEKFVTTMNKKIHAEWVRLTR